MQGVLPELVPGAVPLPDRLQELQVETLAKWAFRQSRHLKVGQLAQVLSPRHSLWTHLLKAEHADHSCMLLAHKLTPVNAALMGPSAPSAAPCSVKQHRQTPPLSQMLMQPRLLWSMCCHSLRPAYTLNNFQCEFQPAVISLVCQKSAVPAGPRTEGEALCTAADWCHEVLPHTCLLSHAHMPAGLGLFAA